MEQDYIQSYVASALDEGKSLEDVYKHLLNSGARVSQIELAYRSHLRVAGKAERSLKVVRIIISVGIAMIGAGVFSFVASNWTEMTKPLKLTVILAGMFAAYGAGWYLKEEKGYVRTGEGLLVLGSIIYGAGIFLVAQMFNVRADWPDGFMLWMIGSLAMAMALRSYATYYVALVTGGVSLFGLLEFIFDRYPGHDSYLLTSTLLLAASLIAAFGGAHYLKRQLPDEIRNRY